jgi:hypothetical protein
MSLQPLSLESKESWHAIYGSKDLMVKMGKLVQKSEKPLFFRMSSLKNG